MDNLDKTKFLEEVKKVRAILDEAKILYWMDFGTLLGAGQQGKMFDWDKDVDFSILKSEIPKFFAVLPKIAALGFRIDVTDSCIYFKKGDNIAIDMGVYIPEGDKAWMLFTKDNPKFNFVLKYLDRIAEKAHYRKYHHGIPFLEKFVYLLIPPFMDSFVRRLFFGICRFFGQRGNAIVLPKKHFEYLTTMRFEGMDFPAPNAPKEYLPLIYGEGWPFPRTDWKWEYVKAMDYNFFNQKDRANYSLFNEKLKNRERNNKKV